MESTPTTVILDLEPGLVIADRYEVLEVIGSGAMGRVVKVIDRTLDNAVVALKILYPHLVQDPIAFARFRNEVLVARSLAHENLVRLYDIGSFGKNQYFISMEFIRGVTLSKRVGDSSRPPLAFDDILRILKEVSSGIAYAHRNKVVHRDLKPDNVMISDEGAVKIADFGLARSLLLNKGLTQTGETVGTPYYMSPEQIRGEELDGRSDVYSFGILAYELVTGSRPFNEDSWFNLANLHLSQPLPRLVSPTYKIPGWFEELVEICAAKDPDDRYPNAEMIVQLLESHTNGAPQRNRVSQMFARPALSGGPKGTWPGAFFAAAGILVFLLAGTLALCRVNERLNRAAGGFVFGLERTSGTSLAPLKAILGLRLTLSPEELARRIASGDAKAVYLLVRGGVDPQAPLNSAGTPYDLALQRPDPRIIKALIDGGADPDFKDGLPLIRAVEVNSPLTAAFLLRNGASPNVKAANGRTALMLAVRKCDDPIVHSLLTAGADVNAKDGSGRTALMYAADRGNLNIVQRLLDWKPALNERNNEGETALSIAVYRGFDQIAKLLVSQGAEISFGGRDGKLRSPRP